MAIQVSIKELLEAGAHFGHQTSRWNPKMRKFIYKKRNGIHIIDLQKTLGQVKIACQFLADCVAQGKEVLMVGTKKQAKEIVKDAAQRANVYWVTERWLGGTLTNLQTIRRSVKRLYEIEEKLAGQTTTYISKKEASALTREKNKLRKNLDGIHKMQKLPGALFVIDPNREKIAIEEARRLGIKIVALIDTNCDPDKIDYPVACNDDAIRTISLLVSKVEQAITEAKAIYSKEASSDEPQETPEIPESPVETVPAVEGEA